jgi:GNAT superfamily N-acetyltransferase
MIISREKPFATDELFELYDSVGWGGYTRDMAKLQRGLSNSHLVITARDDSGRLVGLARTISDDETICYLQDLLVHSEFQGRGIGRALLDHLKDRYSHCKSFFLSTDHESSPDGEKSHAFYRKMGLVPHHEQGMAALGLKIV